MIVQTSVLEDLLQALPQLRPQIYFKSSLTALSHAMEDQVLAGSDRPLVIASFQRERFYRQEAHRYQRIGKQTDQVYILAAPETDFTNSSDIYETVAFDPSDRLSQEWHLVAIASSYATCLICQERETSAMGILQAGGQVQQAVPPAMDQARRFEGIWTFDRQVSCTAAELLLDRILSYRPELADKIARARSLVRTEISPNFQTLDPGPFAQRLVTYLQAGQHKLLKTYRSIADRERKERLVNSIASAIRQSLNPAEIFTVAVQELGQAMGACRCLIYRCKENDESATIVHEFLNTSVKSLSGQTWPLKENPLFQQVVKNRERVYLQNVQTDLPPNAAIQKLVVQWNIDSWLMVPVLYQNQIVGMVELHHCGECAHTWEDSDLMLVEAIATQVGVALIQAEAYANLEDLNDQLEALDRTRSNLIAITGHELRTPLSTIQVCLESLASEPDMPLEVRQAMLSSALTDADRLRKLVQDFLTLSRLESGRVEWHPEPLPLQECVELALSSIRSRRSDDRPVLQITTHLPSDLPLVQADGEWLVEVLAKLIDNACKFTQSQGLVSIQAKRSTPQEIEVLVGDTGRGIEPNRLDAIFDRFYQEEGALRRTQGGTGLGLAICRQIVNSWGGTIWATSAGKDQGSQFHFTVPIAQIIQETQPNPEPPSPKSRNRRNSGSRTRRTTLR